MRQQQENTWAADQIAPRQSLGIPDETKQPFKSRFSNPKGCTLFDTRDEIDRGTDTQRKATGDAALLELLRDDFLLRRADRQKAEPERTAFLDRAQAAFDRRFVANEVHRRIDVTQGSQSETLPKLL